MSTQIISLIDKLNQNMWFKYRWLRDKYMEDHKDDADRIIWVHELCECTQKQTFYRELPQLEESVRLKPPVMLGELVHLGIEHLGYYQPRDVYSKILDIDGRKVMVAGTPDYVNAITSTVVDFKYAQQIGKTPLAHHALQAALYKWLTGMDHAEIWYFTHDEVKAFPVATTLTDEDVKAIVKDNRSPRWTEWECSYCECRNLCSLRQ